MIEYVDTLKRSHLPSRALDRTSEAVPRIPAGIICVLTGATGSIVITALAASVDTEIPRYPRVANLKADGLIRAVSLDIQRVTFDRLDVATVFCHDFTRQENGVAAFQGMDVC